MPAKRSPRSRVAPSQTRAPLITRLGFNGGRNGYRYDLNNGRYKPPKEFYDIFYEKISNHYIIMEEWKDRTKRDTWPLEVYERDKSEQSLEQRCLFLLRQKLVEWGLPRRRVYKAKINEVNY